MTKNWLTNRARSFRAAPWPHSTAGASLLLALGLGYAAHHHWLGDNISEATVFGCWALGWVVVALFAAADAVSRHREYKRIKAMFIKYGYRERILEPLARSRCQRDAVLMAARETGHHTKARDYFRGLGYRWYHILPDTVVRNPFAFLSPTFIRTSFLPGKKARV